jgi:hypothetical protein
MLAAKATRESRMRLVPLFCIAPLLLAGCFNSTDPLTIVGINKATGQEVGETPLVVLYYAHETEAVGGHLRATLAGPCDIQVYVGTSPLTIDPPRHVGCDPFIVPGTYWGQRVWVVAQGYEPFPTIEQSSAWQRWGWKLVPLDEKTIALEAIANIAWFKDDLRLLDAGNGVNADARRRFCSIVLDCYRLWQRRWGDPKVRERQYRNQAEEPYENVSFSTEQRIREAEVVVAKMEAFVGRPPASTSTASHP